MVKVYPAQEINDCRQCPDYDKSRACVEKGLAIPVNVKIPKWCPLKDRGEEHLRPNDLTWEEKHPSNYQFEKVNVDQFLLNKPSATVARKEGK